MKVRLVLADYGQNEAATGKVHLLGAGWSQTAIGADGFTPSCAIALFLEVPWDMCNRPLPVVLELLDEDGRAVSVGPEGHQQPVRVLHQPMLVPPPGSDRSWRWPPSSLVRSLIPRRPRCPEPCSPRHVIKVGHKVGCGFKVLVAYQQGDCDTAL